MNKYSAILLALLVIACTPNDDLRSWMEETKAQKLKNPAKKGEVKPFERMTFNLEEFKGLNAFDPARLSTSRVDSEGNKNRPKEILEGIGLAGIEYVGFVDNHAAKHKKAYVKADGHVYEVKIGNYLGTNFGKIIVIQRDRLVLEEKIENTQGQWEKSQTELLLSTNG